MLYKGLKRFCCNENPSQRLLSFKNILCAEDDRPFYAKFCFEEVGNLQEAVSHDFLTNSRFVNANAFYGPQTQNQD